MQVKRITGQPKEEGTVHIDDGEFSWIVPVIRSKDKLYLAQNEYECCDAHMIPDWELRGDLNDAVDEFLRTE